MARNSDQDRPDGSSLKSQCLGFPAILSLAIALVGPEASPAIGLPPIFAQSGNGTWLAFVIATIGLVFVSLNINEFASRKASSGSMYTYVAWGLGSIAGVLCGWALTIAYTFGGMAAISGSVNYVNVLLRSLGFQVFPFLIFAIGVGLAAFLAYKGIELSTILLLSIQVISVSIILCLVYIVLSKHGFAPDMRQLSLQKVSFQNIQLGLVLAVFSFTGFEGATTMGEEAKKPLKFIPRTVLITPVVVGLFFIISSYVVVLGFEGNQVTLDKSDAPLNVVSNLAGVSFFGVLISINTVISLFAACLANITAVSRILLTMGRHGLLHRSIGRVHRRNQTPHIAIALVGVLIFFVPALLSLWGTTAIKIYEYTGTFASYGFIMTYILVSVAAPVYLYKQQKLRAANVVISVLAVLFLLIPVVGSVYPMPPPPINKLPLLFLMLIVIGGGWFMWRGWRSPRLMEEIKRDAEG